MDFWKLSNARRAVLVGILSLLLALSGVSPQALAEAMDEATTVREQSELMQNVNNKADQTNTNANVNATGDEPKSTANEQAATEQPASEPERWTIELKANGGALVKGTDERATSIESLEDGDPIRLPNAYARETYEFVGWSTHIDPAAWHKAREEALAANPSAPEPADKPLFVPAEASLYNLSYSYVTLADGTVQQVSDVTASQGVDNEGRAVQTCDLRERVQGGKLTLYAQWKKAPADPATEEASKSADATANEPASNTTGNASETSSKVATNPAQGAESGKEPGSAPASSTNTPAPAATNSAPAASATADANATGGIDPNSELPQSANPAPEPPTGYAALVSDPSFVPDSAVGDAQATALLDAAEQNQRTRKLLANSAAGFSPTQLATPLLGSSVLAPQSVGSVTDVRSPQEKEGTTINNFSLVWNTTDFPASVSGEDNDIASLDLTPLDDAALNMQARIQFAVSGDKNYPAGAIQFTIPAQVIRDRNNQPIGTMTIGVPEEPDTTQSFAYRLVTPAEGEGDPYYVITNTRTLDSATTGVIQFSIRGITPHVVKSGQKSSNLQAEMTLTTARGSQIVVGTDPITATINTSENISNVYKNGGRVVEPSEAPAEIRDALGQVAGGANNINNYVLVRWNTYANVHGNRSFDFSMSDDLRDSGSDADAIVADGTALTDTGAVVLGATGSSSDSPSTSYQKLVLDDSYLESGESRYENVWTAYPKSNFEDNKDYTLTNHVTWTVAPLDNGTPSSLSAAASITYHNPQPISFTADPGHYTIEKETFEPHRYSTSTNTSLTDLHGIGTGTNGVAPKDATINFTVDAYGEIMEQTAVEGTDITKVTDYNDERLHQRYVTMEATDDAVYLNGNYAQELGSEDYYISRVHLHDPYVYTYGHEDGDETKEWGYFRNTNAAPLPTVELWGLSETAGGTAQTWTKLATMRYSSTNARTVTVAGGATHDGNSPYINLPKTLNITRAKMVSAAKDYDALRLQYNPSITLKCDESSRAKQLADQLFAASDNPRATLRNDVTLAVYHGNAAESITGHAPEVDPSHAQLTENETASVFAISASSQSVDYARTHEMDKARYGKDMWHYSSLAYLRGATPRIGVTSKKTLAYDENKDLDAGAMRATLHYTAIVHEQSNILTREAYDQYVADGAIAAETSGTWYDLLPPGVTPDLSSIRLRDADSVQDAYIVENYKNTGRTLLVVKASLVPQPAYNDTVEGAVAGEGYWAQGYYDEPRISFDAVYSYADFSAVEITSQNQLDELINVIAFQSGGNELGNQVGMMGEYDNATGGITEPKRYRNKETAAAVEAAPDVPNMPEVMSNLDSATTTKKPTFVYARAENRISVDRNSVSSITKQVASDVEGIYRSGTDDTDAGQGWVNHTNQVNVYEGHGYSYRIEVARGSGQTSGIVLYDALENYQLNSANSDWSIREHRWNGVLTGVDVSHLKSKGVAPVVYYSTTVEGFDGRDSVGQDTRMGTVDMEHVINTLDKSPEGTWVRADQYEGLLSAVKAVAIDCSKASDGSDFVLPQGDSLIAYIRMRAPVEVANDASSKLFKTVNPSGKEDEPNNNSHAFNNVYINSTVTGDSQQNARAEFYHPDYVKVGILPFKITVNKVWDDANDQDGVRPEAVSVELLANGQRATYEGGTTEVPKIKLGSEYAGRQGYGNGGWSYTIEDIPCVDAKNNPIRYTLREDAITKELDDHTTVNLYSPSYLRADDAHLQITNRRVPETVDLVVNKAWNDNNDARGARPSTIRLRLYADGVYMDTKTVREGADGNWSYTFADLPAYKEGEQGKRVDYKVVEEKDGALQHYATDYEASNAGSGSRVAEDGSILGSVNITNTYSDTGLLGISKTVQNVKSEAGRNADFGFKVELFSSEKDAQQNPLPLGDTYSYYVLDADGQRIAGSEGSLRTGDTVTIKGGQRAIVEGLPIGSTYKVTEIATPGFYQSASANTTGTIAAGVTPNHAADASFTNTYSSSGSFQLKATKRLQGQKLGLYAFRFHAYRVFNEEKSGNADPLQNEYEQIERSVSNSAGSDVDANGVSTGDVTFARYNVTDKDLGPDGKLTLLYRIREDQVTRPGYTYAPNVEQVRVTLEDKGNGTIEATQTAEPVESGTSYIKPLGEDTQVEAGTSFHSNGNATFTNSYNATGALELMAWKSLKGGTLTADQFTFRLTALTEGAPMATIRNSETGELSYDNAIYDAQTHSMTAKNDGDGVVNFPAIQLGGANGGKSYIYKVSENIPTGADAQAGVNYSNKVYYYRVDVADDGAGNLTTTNTVVEPKDDAADTAVAAGDPDAFKTSNEQPIITNTLKPGGLAITKRLAPGSGYYGEEFEFRVVLTGDELTQQSSFDCKVGDKDVTPTNVAAAKDSYTMTIGLAKDQTATIANIPAGTSYQVFENTPSGWQLVEQSETTGTIAPQVTKNAVFTNNYEPATARAQLYATKTLDGVSAESGKFSFTLTGQNSQVNGVTTAGAPMPEGALGNTKTVANGDVGLVDFGSITYSEAGTYTYAITENADATNATINYDVSEWTATVTVTNTNTDPTGGPVFATTVTYSNGADEPSNTPPAFANTTKPGDLTLTKRGVNVTSANRDAVFNFTVQLQNSGQPVDNVQYYTEDVVPNTQSEGGEGQNGQNGSNPISTLGRIASGARDALLGLFTPRVAYAEVEDHGTYGYFGVDRSCMWEWDEGTSTVTVRATTQGVDGNVDNDINMHSVPWSAYSNSMEHFFIDGSYGKVTMSSSGATFTSVFYANSSLLTVDLSALSLDSYGDGNQPAWSSAFANSKKLTSVTLPYFSGSSYGINAENMFENCENLEDVEFAKNSNGEASFEIYKASNMFKGCKNLKEISLDSLIIKPTTAGSSLDSMFENCINLTEVSLGIRGAENILKVNRMFYGCQKLVDVDLSKLVYTPGSTPKLDDMNHMFTGCNKLETLNYHGFRTENVTDMNYMFYECYALTALDLSGFDTSSVTKYNGMFRRCTNLTTLDLSGFVTKANSDGSSLFSNGYDGSAEMGGRVLTKIVLGNGWTEAYTNAGLPEARWVKLEDVAAGKTKVLTSDELMGRSNEEYNTNALYKAEYSGTWVRAVDPTQYYVVNLNPMGGYYATDNTALPGTITAAVGTDVTLPTPKDFVQNGTTMKFVGWRTGYNAETKEYSGKKFAGGATVNNSSDSLNPQDGYATLFAEWAPYVVTKATKNIWEQNTACTGYNLVGSTEFEFNNAGTVNVPNTPDGFVYKPESFAYSGGSYSYDAANSTYTVSPVNGATLDFYYDRVTYTVAFKENGGTGTMANLTMVGGVAQKLPANAFTREGYSFLGWNTAADGSGTPYTDQQQIKNLANNGQTVELFAQWIPASGNQSSSTGTYSFTLKADQRVRFTNVPAGTTYTVVETNAPNGWTQTGSSHTAGTIKAAETAEATITNTYDATGVVSLQARKTMSSGSLAEGQFGFQLVDNNGDVKQTVYNQAPEDGQASAEILFNALEYKLSDLLENGKFAESKTFLYTIREVVPNQATNGVGVTWAEADADTRAAGGFSYEGVKYDSTSNAVSVTVSDAGTGKLTVTPSNVTVTNEGNKVVTTVNTEFINDYEPGALEVSKTTTGTNEVSANATFAFSVKLADAQGNPISRSYDLVKRAADGTEARAESGAVFNNGTAEIKGIYSGESFRIEGIAKDATYEVTEFDMPGGFTQSAVEGNEGTIGAGQTSKASFTNTYEATGSVTLAAKKTLEGGNLANYTFTFQLFDQTNKPLQIKTSDAAGNVTFDALGFSAADAGTQDAPKKYTYKIAEVNDAQQNVVYDTHSGWLDVNVWDNGQGVITAEAKYDHEGGTKSAEPETFKNKLLHPVELPATGGSGLAVPVAVVVIVATAEAARRMRRRRRE